jgi:hypothetical protein
MLERCRSASVVSGSLSGLVMLCLAGVAEPPVSPVAAVDMHLVLGLAAESSVTVGGPVVVTVTMRNAGSRTVTILPFLFPEHARSVLGGLPLNILSFDIRRADGRAVPSLRLPGEWWRAVLARPRPCDLLGLAVGAFYGRRIILNEGEWAHRLTERGRYEVRARFSSNAREWFEHGLKEKAFASWQLPPGELVKVFSGVLESEPVQIEIR